MKKIGRHLTFANVVACLALFIALGGVSYAAFKLPKNSVGAKQLKKSAVTPAKLSAAARSTLTGPTGPKGETGAPATALWAVVSKEGALLHGTALSSTLNGGAGTYFVNFGRNVSGCALVVTTQEQAARTRAEPLVKDPNTVFVVMENSGQVEVPFSLAVFC